MRFFPQQVFETALAALGASVIGLLVWGRSVSTLGAVCFAVIFVVLGIVASRQLFEHERGWRSIASVLLCIAGLALWGTAAYRFIR